MAVVDAAVAERAGWPMATLASAFLDGGARLIQVRAKAMAGSALLDVAAEIVTRAHAVGARVVVNDRADIAVLSGADGVHVGQDDLRPAQVRVLVGPAAIVGLSTHTSEQVDEGCGQAVSYVAIGPVFGTATKQTGYEPIGLGRVADAAARTAARGLPLVAIGGITLDTVVGVIEAGAACAAVISDLVATGDPAARVRAYLERLTV
jgi:thiamine-phosphate pyrophosphorylase